MYGDHTRQCIEQCLGPAGEQRRGSMAENALRITASALARVEEDGHFVVELSSGDRQVVEMERLGRAAGADELMIAAGENHVEERLSGVAGDRLGQKRWEVEFERAANAGEVRRKAAGCSINRWVDGFSEGRGFEGKTAGAKADPVGARPGRWLRRGGEDRQHLGIRAYGDAAVVPGDLGSRMELGVYAEVGVELLEELASAVRGELTHLVAQGVLLLEGLVPGIGSGVRNTLPGWFLHRPRTVLVAADRLG